MIRLMLAVSVFSLLSCASEQVKLHTAIYNGNTSLAQQFILEGSDVNLKDAKGWSPIMYAAQSGDLEITKQLVTWGARINDQNKKGGYPLGIAALHRKTSVVSLLLNSGAEIDMEDDHGWTPIMFAAQGGSTTIIRKLVESRAEVNARNAYAATPLYIASYHGQIGAVSQLLNAGADPTLPDQLEWTPLMAAASRGHLSIVKQLDTLTPTEHREHEGRTALYIASQHGQAPIVSYLIARGANIEIQDNYGYTPVNAAARKGYKYRPAAYVLIRGGAKPNIILTDFETTAETLHAFAEFYGFLGDDGKAMGFYQQAIIYLGKQADILTKIGELGSPGQHNLKSHHSSLPEPNKVFGKPPGHQNYHPGQGRTPNNNRTDSPQPDELLHQTQSLIECYRNGRGKKTVKDCLQLALNQNFQSSLKNPNKQF